MKRYIFFLFLNLALVSLAMAQLQCERIFAVTDKECYLAGERLLVRVDALMPDDSPAPSRVAYVEIADTRQMYTQAMVALSHGQGWAEIPLPARMHSGSYQLTVYTRAMRNFGPECFFHTLIGVINGEQLSRRDDVRFLPYQRYTPTDTPGLLSTNTYMAGTKVEVRLPETNAEGCAVSVDRAGVHAPLAQGSLSVAGEKMTSKVFYNPEQEGHILRADLGTDTAHIAISRLALVGQRASIYDGRKQDDGSYHYYVPGVYGDMPTLVTAYNEEGHAVPIHIVSPYAQHLPKSLPSLIVYSQEPELLARATAARRQNTASLWLGQDTLVHSTGFLKSEPDYFYDLDEYTSMSTIREVLLEFVKGVRRSKYHGVNMLYTVEMETRRYSRWPALVLLDGVPVYDVDEILNYDSHLVKYVQVYTDRFFFGNSCCQGVISFITRHGRLSNYKLNAAQQLTSYSFPQDHPVFVNQTADCHGTVLWSPSVRSHHLTFDAPTESGIYRVTVQGRDAQGQPFRQSAQFVVPKM